MKIHKSYERFGQGLAVLILIGIPVGIYFLIKFLFNFFGHLEQNNQVTFISILFSSLIGLIIYLIQKYYEKKKDIDIELIKRKSESLNEIIVLWFDYNTLGNKFKNPNELLKKQNEYILKLFDASQKNLCLWAHEETLIFYSNMRTKMANQGYGTNSNEIMKDFGNFMKLIRKELGHKDRKLKNSHIFGLYINDIHTIASQIDN